MNPTKGEKERERATYFQNEVTRIDWLGKGITKGKTSLRRGRTKSWLHDKKKGEPVYSQYPGKEKRTAVKDP